MTLKEKLLINFFEKLMEDTFDDIQNTIKTSIDVNTYKNIKIIE